MDPDKVGVVVAVEPDKVHRRKFWFYDRRGRERNMVNRGLLVGVEKMTHKEFQIIL